MSLGGNVIAGEDRTNEELVFFFSWVTRPPTNVPSAQSSPWLLKVIDDKVRRGTLPAYAYLAIPATREGHWPDIVAFLISFSYHSTIKPKHDHFKLYVEIILWQKAIVIWNFGYFMGKQKEEPVHPMRKCLQARAPSTKLPLKNEGSTGVSYMQIIIMELSSKTTQDIQF